IFQTPSPSSGIPVPPCNCAVLSSPSVICMSTIVVIQSVLCINLCSQSLRSVLELCNLCISVLSQKCSVVVLRHAIRKSVRRPDFFTYSSFGFYRDRSFSRAPCIYVGWFAGQSSRRVARQSCRRNQACGL